MPQNYEELAIKFSADMSGVKAGIDKGVAQFGRLEKQVATSTSKMSSQIGGLGRLFKLDLLIRYGSQLIALETQMEKMASAIKDTADRADVSAEALQRLRFVADQNGSSAEALDKSLIKLNKAMGQARLGAEGMGEVFDALGLGDLIRKGASTEEVFYALADSIGGMKDESQAAAIVAKLMGREADALIETFKLGSVETQKLGESLKSVIPAEMIEKLDAANDKTAKFNQTLNYIGAAASTVFTDVVIGLGQIGTELEKQFKLASQIELIYGNIKKYGMLAGYLGDSLPTGEQQHSKAKHSVKTLSPIRATAVVSKPNEGALRQLLGGGSGTKGADDANRSLKQYEEAIAELSFELQQLARSEEEAAYQEQLRNSLQSAGVALDTERGQAIALLVSQIQSQRDALEAVSQMDAANAEAMQRWQDLAQGAGDAVADAFGRAILQGESLRETFQGLLQDLAELIFQKLVFESISNAISGAGGIGGLIGGFASGGGVNPGNTYMVGERGPELFVPKVPGNIVPNRSLGGGGSSVVIHQVINADGANPATLALMRQMLAQNKDETIKTVKPFLIDQQRRGRMQGAFA